MCDKSLVMAPPSIHPKTGNRYKWVDKWRSPFKMPAPAPCPRFVLEAPATSAATSAPLVAHSIVQPARTPQRPSWTATIEAIPDIPSLVRSWGVRTVGQPRSTGWLPCHAVDREDSRPSAAIHVRSGYYVDSGSGLKLGLVDLAVVLGVYHSPTEAIKDLGERYAR